MYVIEDDRKYGFENDENAFLTCFLNSPLKSIGRRYRIGMILLGSGGYSTVQEREGEPVALRYVGYGIQCFVLKYSTEGDNRYVNALRQLCESVALIRENCDKWDVDPERIVVCGFSAGGHLAASLGCYGKQLSAWVRREVRPNALMLGYPVITTGDYAHGESVANCLLCNKLSKDDISLEKHVGGDMPPTYIWACADDNEVPIQNTLLFATALAEKQIPHELHIFGQGGHGGSLGDECTARIEGQINERYAKWFELSLSWLKEVL